MRLLASDYTEAEIEQVATAVLQMVNVRLADSVSIATYQLLVAMDSTMPSKEARLFVERVKAYGYAHAAEWPIPWERFQ